MVHINGRAHAGFSSIWTSAGQRFATAPAGSPGGPPIVASVTTPTATIPATPTATILGTNGTGQIKLAPESLYSYARIYAGADAMAANGLRYGAAIELRQNFTGQISSNTSTGASGYSSLETLFVRRAFTYVAGDQWGIVRAGQADGIISLFDNGVTTFQFLPTNNLQNGDDFAALTPAGASVPFFFLSGTGTEYANTKLVYLSPQIAGVDFGIQYAPNTSNGYGISGGNNPLNGSITGPGIGTGLDCARPQIRGAPRFRPAPASWTVLALSIRPPSACAIRAHSAVSVCWHMRSTSSAATQITPVRRRPRSSAIRWPAAGSTASTTRCVSAMEGWR